MSCLVDRSSSKIAFISSAEGGVDIEDVAKNKPEKIITIKINLSQSVNQKDIKKIIEPFNLSEKTQKYMLYQNLKETIEITLPLNVRIEPNKSIIIVES